MSCLAACFSRSFPRFVPNGYAVLRAPCRACRPPASCFLPEDSFRPPRRHHPPRTPKPRWPHLYFSREHEPRIIRKLFLSPMADHAACLCGIITAPGACSVIPPFHDFHAHAGTRSPQDSPVSPRYGRASLSPALPLKTALPAPPSADVGGRSSVIKKHLFEEAGARTAPPRRKGVLSDITVL